MQVGEQAPIRPLIATSRLAAGLPPPGKRQKGNIVQPCHATAKYRVSSYQQADCDHDTVVLGAGWLYRSLLHLILAPKLVCLYLLKGLRAAQLKWAFNEDNNGQQQTKARWRSNHFGFFFFFLAFSHKTCNELHPISPTISCLLFGGRPLVQILATTAPRPVIVTKII